MPKSKSRKKKHKKLNLTKSKFKSPTSLSIFPERSPQLQDKEPNVLNAFTTKNISVRDKQGQQWNTIVNNKLAYKRSARGAQVGSYPYDRGSVVFRGPFTYHKTLRGPNLLLTANDIGYRHNIYKFVIPVNKLKTEILYIENGQKSRRRTSKKKKSVKRKQKTLKRKRRKHSKN